MPSLLRVPDLGPDTTEVTVVNWLVAENEDYPAGTPLAAVETAKAAADIEADTPGVLVKKLVAEGDEVRVAAPLGLVAAPGERIDDVEAALVMLGIRGQKNPINAGGAEDPLMAASSAPALAELRQRVFTSPLARRMAREAGISDDHLTGTGPGGRIVRRDVELAIAALKQPRTDVLQVADALPADQQLVAPVVATAGPSRSYTDVPPSKMRRAIASRLSHSKQTVPHFYLRNSARVDRLLRLRTELNERSTIRVSVTDLLLKAVGKAHDDVPDMNVIWIDNMIRRFRTTDIGLAVTSEHGLSTPVVRDVANLTLRSTAAAAKDLADRAREGKLAQCDIEGGSITITNLGMFGTPEFAAIINPPQSAILAVGATVQVPVVDDGEIKLATVIQMTLSVDHRAIDGAVAARWMQHLVEILEHPMQLLT